MKYPILCLKLNVRAALVNGERIVLDSAPFMDNGSVMIPKAALSAAGIDAYDEYTTLDCINGVYKLYNEMGLIIMDSSEDILSLTTENDKMYLLTLANSFIFDIPLVKLTIGSYAPATDEEREGFVRVGDYALSILKSRNNTHPFLFANEEVFTKLRSIYEADDGSNEHRYVSFLVEKGKEFAKKSPELNETGDGFASPFPDSNYGEDEYDAGGRHTESETRLTQLKYLAFAYHMTGEERLAKVAYYASLAIIGRKHWGPGHFLNCSGAVGALATVYDWLYNAWKKMGLDTDAIKRGIYSQGIHHGFNSVIYDCCDYPSPKQGTGWRFKLKPDNWNAVCNSGLIISSLCVLNDGVDSVINEEMYAKTKELLGACLTSNMQDGLVYTQYAPDGSYIESNSYWSYGTGNLFKTMGALYTALGTDLGMHNGCGLDKTCYYALNSESADFVGWNYHDGHTSRQDTSLFNLFATVSGDHMLYALRQMHLSRGKEVTVEDMLFHPAVLGTDIPELTALPLDYVMGGIDAFVVRDGWEGGSLYAGMMGGPNAIGGSHNQVDSGSFVYHNLGKMWITDMGSDNYNLAHNSKGQGYFSNYGLYRRNAEGNNTLALKALPYGQLLGKRGVMTQTHSSDNASYCIIDNLEVYGGDLVKSAKRGMLLTNGRKTLVIRDEVEFVGTETAFWIAHFESDKITATLSDDGKLCTLTHKDGPSISLSLIADGAKMEIMNCYDFLLDETETVEGEHSRENHSRIVIKFENVTAINASVVIEEKESNTPSASLPIDEWKNIK